MVERGTTLDYGTVGGVSLIMIKPQPQKWWK